MKQPEKMELVNVDAERIVLGKIIADNSRFWDLKDRIQPWSFTKKIHQDIFEAIHDMNIGGREITLRTLQARVGAEYDNGLSTMMLITSMIREVEDIDEINEYVILVVDLWKRRRTLEVINQFAAEVKKPSTDTSYMLMDFENCIKDITDNSQDNGIMTLGDYAQKALSSSMKIQKSGISESASFGLASVTEIMGNFYTGELGYVLAPQGHGKTVIGSHIARAAASVGWGGVFFQIDMDGEVMGSRSLSQETGVRIGDIREGSYDTFQQLELKQAQESLMRLPIYIDARPRITIEQICEKAMVMKRMKNIKFIVIDHMRLVSTNKRITSKFDRMEYVSDECRALAKDLDICVIGLSQVTRESQRRDDPFPRVSDSDLGSSVEQDADWAIGAFRRDYWLRGREPYNKDSAEYGIWQEDFGKANGKIELRCLKGRNVEPGRSALLRYDGPRFKIEELEY